MDQLENLPADPAPRINGAMQEVLVSSCWELKPGTEVRAKAAGRQEYTGKVLDIHPALELFWMMTDEGERRIIELSEYLVSSRLRASDSEREARCVNARQRKDWELQA